MARKKKNPSTLTKVIVGGLAVVGGYAIYKGVQYSREQKAKKKKKVAQTPEAICAKAYAVGTPEYDACVASAKGEQTKQKQKKTQGKYVGTGWTGWPHKDLFTDEAAFGDGLLGLGYGISDKFGTPEWSIRGPIEIGAVKQLQEDWNFVLAHAHGVLVEFVGPGAVQMIPLTVDGKIGTNTTNAMFNALQIDDKDTDWRDLVEEIKNSQAQA